MPSLEITIHINMTQVVEVTFAQDGQRLSRFCASVFLFDFKVIGLIKGPWIALKLF